METVIPKVTIAENELKNNEGKVIGKVAVFIGGLGMSNPKAILDNAVAKYVQDVPYYQYISSGLDNPWLRVIMYGVDAMDFKEFNEQKIIEHTFAGA
ncbi:MAG: hypothetical protein V4543_02020 [Bacteroidota bacterium]